MLFRMLAGANAHPFTDDDDDDDDADNRLRVSMDDRTESAELAQTGGAATVTSTTPTACERP